MNHTLIGLVYIGTGILFFLQAFNLISFVTPRVALSLFIIGAGFFAIKSIMNKSKPSYKTERKSNG